MAGALGAGRRLPRRRPGPARAASTAWRCCRIPAAACTWGTCATTRSATRWRASERMRGEQVLHVIGWDAFGLPAENAAIEHGEDPRAGPRATSRRCARSSAGSGFGYDWTREIATCEPAYYRWNQWFFLRMLERGLAYRARRRLNWCDVVRDRAGERAGARRPLLALRRPGGAARVRPVVPAHHRYADELLDGLDRPLRMAREGPRRCSATGSAGASGARVRFAVEGGERSIEIFTTRIDTIYGATYLALAAEHPDVLRSRARPAAGARGRADSSRSSWREEPRGALRRGRGEARRLHRAPRDPPVHRRADPDLGRELRAHGRRHRRDHERAGPRCARLRVRPGATRCRSSRSCDRRGRGAARRRRRSTSRSSRGRRPRRLGPYTGLTSAAARRADDAADAERGGFGRARRSVYPPEGLGRLAPAHTGARRSRSSTASVAGSSRCPTSELPVAPARRGAAHRRGRVAAGPARRRSSHDLSALRRAGAARHRHDGHLRRLVLVLLPLSRSARTSAAPFDCGGGRVPGFRSTCTSAGSSTRRCT